MAAMEDSIEALEKALAEPRLSRSSFAELIERLRILRSMEE